MDFHNMKNMRGGIGLLLALSAPAPAVVVLGVYLTTVNPALAVEAPNIARAVIGLLFSTVVVTAVGGYALGRWMGRKIDAPLWHWAEFSNELYTKKEDGDESIPYLNHKGAIGKLARRAEKSREWLYDRAREAKEQEEKTRVSEEARARQDASMQATAEEQAGVVAALAAGLSQLAEGHLTYRVTEAFPESHQQLKDDFNAAMEQLQGAMRALLSNAQGIRASTRELSQSSEDLSRRTESQAASLEETAAALDHITTAVNKTAEGATDASDVVSVAKADAENSRAIVHDAVSAMGGIEKSAQQISQIIGVIDEIAFQTNLLALNAGVEAARAGEAGRGFAVVATEVRALAQRSAEAAKEIKALISTSTEEVSKGVRLVGDTGDTLERILSKVGEINNLVADIAASAKEQALGLHEINGSINQMDNVTQQNAAMVEESTAACFTLASDAQQLADLIERFEIGEARKAAAAAPEPRAPAAQRPVTEMRTVGSGGAALRHEPEEAGWEEF